MMKTKRTIRSFSVVLALVMLISAPASADEVSNLGNWINLLDYDTANSSGSNTVSLSSGTTEVVYTYPSLITPGYIDAVVWCDHSFTVKNNGSQDLTVLYIGNNLYRVYGACPSGYSLSRFRLIVTVSSASTFEVKSFRICIVQGASHVAEKGTMRVTGGNLSSTYLATQSSTTSALKCTFPHGSSYSSDMYFAAQIYLNDWRKYDYLDFYLYLYVDALESVTCMMGDAMVPLAVQYIDSVDSGNASISVVARVDLTGLARSSSSTPILTIRALVDNTSTSSIFDGHYIVLQSVSGYVCPEGLDVTVSWIQKLIEKLGYWFSLVQGRIDIIGSQLVENLNTITNSIKTEVKNITDRLDTLINGNGEESELIEGAENISDQVSDIGSYEQEQQEVLDQALPEITQAVSVSSFSASLAFVQRYLNLGWLALGDFTIIYTLPIFIGLFFFICGRLPGATRALYRPPKQKGGSS